MYKSNIPSQTQLQLFSPFRMKDGSQVHRNMQVAYFPCLNNWSICFFISRNMLVDEQHVNFVKKAWGWKKNQECRGEQIPLNLFSAYQDCTDLMLLCGYAEGKWALLCFYCWCLVKRDCLIQTFSITVGLCFVFLLMSTVTGYVFTVNRNHSMHSCSYIEPLATTLI